MFARFFKKKAEEVDAYCRDFTQYGEIGSLGGFTDHLDRIGKDSTLSLSDKKYRDAQSNKLGPLYANRSLRGHIHGVTTTAWSPTTPTLLISASKDGNLFSWDVGSCSKQSSHRVTDGSDLIMASSISPGNDLIACGGVGGLCYLLNRNTQSGAITTSGVTIHEHEGFITSCPFVSSAKILTASGDYSCKLFDVSRPSICLSTFTYENEVMATSLRAQPDGTTQEFFAASGNGIFLWDIRAPSSAAAQVKLDGDADITSLSVCKSKDYLVACGTESGDCYVYDMRGGTGRCVAACIDSQLTQPVSSVAFSHSGSMIFAGYRKWVKNYMDCVLVAFDVSASCYGERPELSGGDAAEVELSPHCVIGDNPGITSSVPFTYSYQPCHSTFVSSVQLNCDGCALATASHDGLITVFRQQR
jgi:guanine nucleotide-binding protein G(I)/G(S)/G(T) subunit beta-1